MALPTMRCSTGRSGPNTPAHMEAEFAASHHLGLGVSFAPLKAKADVMTHDRALGAEYGWEPTADDLICRATMMVGDADEEAQEGVHHYWSARAAGGTPQYHHRHPGSA
jgi:hypothetical protein